jgi:hypothetical protein
MGLTGIKRTAVVATCVLAVGMLSGCGGSSSSDSKATSPPRKTTTTVSADLDAMDAALLVVSDLPAGWEDSGEEGSSNSADPEMKAMAAGVPSCDAFIRQSEIDEKMKQVTSNEFVEPPTAGATDANSVSNNVVAYDSEQESIEAFDAYNSPDTEKCISTLFDQLLTDQIASQMPEGMEPPTTDVTVERLDVPEVGDGSLAYRVTLTMVVGEETTAFAFVIETVRVGIYGVNYNASLYSPTPPSFGENLVASSIARFEGALK